MTEDVTIEVTGNWATLEQGLDYIKKNISGWLTDTTIHGSGDDLTTILVFKTLNNESTTKRETDSAN